MQVYVGKPAFLGISCFLFCLSIDGQTYVRLQHGTSAHDGRVEYFAVGVWGTICDQDWTNADASVVCHMLGFPR